MRHSQDLPLRDADQLKNQGSTVNANLRETALRDSLEADRTTARFPEKEHSYRGSLGFLLFCPPQAPGAEGAVIEPV